MMKATRSSVLQPRGRRRVALAAAVWSGLLIGGPRADDEPSAAPEPVAIRDVVANVNATSRRRVLVRGVVTWRGQNGAIVQDDSGGIWIDTPGEPQPPTLRVNDPAVLDRLAPGLEVEVVGWTNRGGFSPNIFPEAICILGEKPEPLPGPIDRDRFFSGADDCLRVTASGVVQGFRDSGSDWLLVLDDGGRRFAALVPKTLLSGPPEPLVDAAVRLVGVGAMRFNTRGEFVSPRLMIVRASDIAIERPASASAFDAPAVPLHAIAQYSPEPSGRHRIKTQGSVTFAEPAKFLYLQQGTMGVRVETTSSERFVPGDLVEVAGFIDRQRGVAGVVEAVVRRIDSDRPLQPIRVTPDSIIEINRHASYYGAVAAPGDYKGCLVSFPARVIDVQASGPGGLLLLHSGSTNVIAVATPDTFRAIRLLEPGSDVEAVGIVNEEPSDTVETVKTPQNSQTGRLQLLLRSADDIHLVRAPSWWKPHRLAAALLAAATVAGIATGWVVLLRRQVAKQMGLLETKLQAEATAEERQRIAREFHDSLEQGLAGLSLRLDVAVHEAGDERTRGVLRQQRQLLAGIQTEARGFLWDLRDPVHVEGSLRESITAQLRLLQPLSAAEIVLDAVGPSPDVAPAVQYQLVRIVREAVTNAIRHARARRIDVGIHLEQPPGDPGRVCLTVADDGEGFDIGARSAVEGHYGLRGMLERARRIGAGCAVDSGPGRGTRVVVTVPVRCASAGLGNGESDGRPA